MFSCRQPLFPGGRRFLALASSLLSQPAVVAQTTTKASRRTGSTRLLSSHARLRRRRHYQRPEFAAKTSSGFGKLQEPYQHQEDDLDSYLEKTSLSPWVPMPEVVARKVLDISQAGPESDHVDLGSGDGRVCFQAIQNYGVKSSVGIDVDPGIVQVANERRAKRHPAPDHLQFIVADLMDPENEPVWEHVINADIITMYFAAEALEKFRPLLELKLAGKTCKIVTCGYAMPGWESAVQEVVLGTQVHLYNWGSTEGEEEEDDDEFLFAGPDILSEKPKEMLKNHIEGDKFQGANVIDKTGQHAIRGFNPNVFNETLDDDADWELENSDDENEEDEKESISENEITVDKHER